MRNNVLITVFLLGVLLAAVALQKSKKTLAHSGQGIHLSRSLGAEIVGWSFVPVSLGATEASSGAVEKVLRFDDVLYREYRGADGRAFTVYVAYWSPGKMPVQIVASHAPDRCWTENGWRCEAVDYHLVLRGGDTMLREGQGRLFRDPQGRLQHVVYWHLIGQRLYDFGERSNRMPSVWRWWREVARQVTGRPEEQYFMRLASERPFSELEGDPGFQEIMRTLGRLGLAASAPAPSR